MPASNNQIARILEDNPIEGVDFADGMKRFSMQASIYLRIINVFIKSTPEMLEKLAQVTPETIADYTISIHGFKGSCYGISAMALGDEAKALELASKAGDWETIKRDNPRVIEHARVLLEQFAEIVALIEDADAGVGLGDTRPLVAKPDAALIERLLEASQAFDVEALETILGELDQARYSACPGLVKDLKEKLALFNYDLIEQRAKELLVD